MLSYITMLMLAILIVLSAGFLLTNKRIISSPTTSEWTSTPSA